MELQDLQDTADLARLNMGEAELRAAFPAFEEMLSFFAAMQQGTCAPPVVGESALESVPQAGGGDVFSAAGDHTDGMAAHTRLVDAGWFRADGASPGNSPDGLSEQLLSKAGERDGRFVVIPNVL
jgi:aspartyl-tRNA(Asn)/glutamyl-tRNA(Gln) amidotransferase subunit C